MRRTLIAVLVATAFAAGKASSEQLKSACALETKCTRGSGNSGRSTGTNNAPPPPTSAPEIPASAFRSETYGLPSNQQAADQLASLISQLMNREPKSATQQAFDDFKKFSNGKRWPEAYESLLDWAASSCADIENILRQRRSAYSDGYAKSCYEGRIFGSDLSDDNMTRIANIYAGLGKTALAIKANEKAISTIEFRESAAGASQKLRDQKARRVKEINRLKAELPPDVSTYSIQSGDTWHIRLINHGEAPVRVREGTVYDCVSVGLGCGSTASGFNIGPGQEADLAIVTRAACTGASCSDMPPTTFNWQYDVSPFARK
jgi:hypothetical protein